MQNKIEINLTLDETATTLYWDGGAFVNDPCMFTADKETLEFKKATDAAIKQFGEQPFEVTVVGWNQVPEIKKGERFTYKP